jgi:hypothetical protein
LIATETALHDATVVAPLRQMAEEVSPVPELWLAEFGKHFKVDLKDGKLAVLTSAGEPAMLKDSPVEFTRGALTTLLAKSDDPTLKAFKTIMVASYASGGGAGGAQGGRAYFGNDGKQSEPAQPERVRFGLR